jgi:arginase
VRIGLLGAPTSVGSHHAGQEDAPDAIRAAGLVGLLEHAGHTVTDHGNLTRRPHRAAPRVQGVRAVEAVADMLAELVPAVTAIVNRGEIPFVLGGDCTITLGVLAGVPQRPVHLLYIDGDADLSSPASGSGVLDSMGIAHLLGLGAPELAPFVEAAALASQEITLFGTNPAELDDVSRGLINSFGLHLVDAGEVAASPELAASRALVQVPPDRPLVLHLDVDVLDSGDLPLANFPHFGGISLEALETGLRAFAQHPVAAITLTEVNPSYDPTGQALASLVHTLAAALHP